MTWWTKHEQPIRRADLIYWDSQTHGWSGGTFGPTVDKTERPTPEQPVAHRLRTDPSPTAPIDPWREARQHFGRFIAEVKK